MLHCLVCPQIFFGVLVHFILMYLTRIGLLQRPIKHKGLWAPWRGMRESNEPLITTYNKHKAQIYAFAEDFWKRYVLLSQHSLWLCLERFALLSCTKHTSANIYLALVRNEDTPMFEWPIHQCGQLFRPFAVTLRHPCSLHLCLGSCCGSEPAFLIYSRPRK